MNKALVITLLLLCINAGQPATAGNQGIYSNIFMQAEKGNKEAYSKIKAAAEHGNAEAEMDYSTLLEVKGQHKQSIVWLTKSAAQGYVFAETELAQAYAYGINTQVSPAEAIKWGEKAYQSGVTKMDMFLGHQYDANHQPTAAIKMYRHAISRGNWQGYFELAQIFEHGDGVIHQDLGRALQFYAAGAQHGDINSITTLGKIYVTGTGVPRDMKHGIAYYKAGMQEIGNAAVCADMESVGGVYFNHHEGESPLHGPPMTAIEALALEIVAAAHSGTKNALHQWIEKSMEQDLAHATPDEIKAATVLSGQLWTVSPVKLKSRSKTYPVTRH